MEYWHELYTTHASTSAYQRKVEKSSIVIKEFLSHDIKSYGSISGGKDSTAMMHLINQIDPSISFVSEKDDMDFPNELDYMDCLRERYDLNLTIISPPVKLWDVIMDHNFMEDIHSKGTNFSDTYFYSLLRNYQEQHGFNGVFLGLRAGESKGRKFNYMTNGAIYFNKSWQQTVCQPLAEWTAQDVFAYLFSNEIPILDVYFKTKFVGTPEKIRKSWILPSAQANRGQALWLKYYYPDIFRRLAIINPQIRTYV